MAFSQKLHSNLSRLAIPPKQQSTTNDWSPYQSEPVPPGVGRAPRAVGVPHRPPVAAYAVPTSLAAMSLSPGDVFNLPPPPPRSPGSAGSGSFPQQRLVVQPPSIQTTLGGVHQQGLSGGSSPYPYSPSITLNTPLSPYDPGSLPFSHLSRSQNNSATNSPMASRPSTGNTMVTEYNPQQWGRTGASSGSAGAQYRPFNTRVQNVLAPRALDDSGAPLDSPPPPYSPPPNQSISQTLRPAQHRSPLSQPNPRSPPNLHTSFPSPQATLAAEYASPLSAVTVISAMTGHNRNEPPLPPLSFPPPPGANRDRSSSRSRPEGRSRFTLSALTRGKSSDRSNANAIDSLQQGTNEALARAPGQWSSPSQALVRPGPSTITSINRQTVYMPAGHEPVPPAPPASRRSASTGALSANQYVPPRGQPFRTQHAALPGPPPGPPPSSSRSASMSRASDEDLLPISIASDMGNNAVPIIAPPIRRPHHRGTQLGPVPPTPADWTEFPLSPLPPQMRKPSPHPLSVETGSGNEPHPEPVQLTPATSLPSAPPRESSVKPIRERRSESRAARGKSGDFSTTESGHNPFVLSPESADAKPANLVLTSPNSGMSRQPAVKKARASPIVSRFEGRGKDAVRPDQASTPPFSPATEPKNAFTRSPALPTKALPTPPPQSSSSQLFLSPSGSLGIRSPDERPISHILHTPHLEDLDSKSPPLIPQNVSQLDAALGSSSSDQFTQQAMDRHRAFLRRESQAVSDSERLALFANYMVTESRIRRDRYSAAFALMEASDIMDLTRNLWRSQQPSPSTNTDHGSSFPTPVRPGPSRADSIDSFASMSSPPSSAHTNFTPRTEPESPGSACSSNGGAPDKNMWTRHQPVLSPIPSMAMSTVPDPDEEESRGRAPSRWWESSAGSAGAGQRIERSKRESKYMGLRPEALATLQWQEEPSPSLHSNSTPRTVSQQTGEYPPEKVGWHEELDAGPAATPTYLRPSVPSTPDPHKLDVSRLVTLPPPYPRHYPAMHNNHPDLETLRSNLEHLRDLDDVSRPKEIFCTKVSQRRELQAQELNDRHAQMRHNIQEQLQLGQMSYADAAVAEENFSAEEARNAHRNVQEEFNHFQPEVMTPLHALLSERITKATAGLTQIRAGLSTSADNPSPNHTQEEGDEKPELLEKLNLLKWLFEARESLHKELFVLEGEKNERYREVIMMPFRSPGNEDKLQHAEAFFDSDRQERKLAFEKATLKRFEEFAKIVEENVMRGVEDQLNAFWDIAPPLLAVVQRVPHDLRDFEIQIPEMEYEDNPQYHDYPLQYLFSLLTHTEKSAYQFIESQINLMCLLHEAHTGVMAAGIRLLETQRCGDGEDWKDVTSEMGECRKAEEGRLTMELKDKVETVESQWREALGSGLGEVKQRVENFLVGTGGWDDGLLE